MGRAFHGESAEGRVLVADFARVFLPGAIGPHLGRVHALELPDGPAIWRRRPIECHGLVDAASNILAAAFFDGLLCWQKKIVDIAVWVFDGNFSDDIGCWLHLCALSLGGLVV